MSKQMDDETKYLKNADQQKFATKQNAAKEKMAEDTLQQALEIAETLGLR